MPKTKPTKTPVKKPDIKNDVMSAIKSGQVTMKPKAYFILGSILLGGGIAIAAILTLLFIGVTIFHLRTQNPIGFLRYGTVGGPIFLRLFPWKALIFSIVGIWSGLALLKKYDISYKKSFAGISLAFVGALIVFAFILDQVGVGDRLEKTKPLSPLYKQQFIQDNMLMGEVVAASQSALVVRDPRSGKDITVARNEKTLLPQGADFEVGDHVGAVGYFEGDVFVAKGIHEGGMRWRKNDRFFDGEHLPMMRPKISR